VKIPRGVRLSAFIALRTRALELQQTEGPLRPFADGTHRLAGTPLTTADVNLEIVKPETASTQCAYVDFLPESSRTSATIYVSHAWKYDFVDVVDCLEQMAQKEDGIWFCLLINNQHETENYDYNFLEGQFRTNVEGIGRTVLVLAPWSAPISLTRAWCLF
jgi:hypothetical protein